MNSENKSHPVATLAEICLRIGTLFSAVGCLLIGYCALVGTTPDNVALMSYKIWGLRVAFSGSLYMIIAPVVRYSYMDYLWRHHYALMLIGFIILLYSKGSLEELEVFKSPGTFIVMMLPLIFVTVMMKLRPLPRGR